jgi:hypothetical protein
MNGRTKRILIRDRMGYVVLGILAIAIVAYIILTQMGKIKEVDAGIIAALIAVASGVATYYFNEVSNRNFSLCKEEFESKLTSMTDAIKRLKEMKLIIYLSFFLTERVTDKNLISRKEEIASAALSMSALFPQNPQQKDAQSPDDYISKLIEKIEGADAVKLESIRIELSNKLGGQLLNVNIVFFGPKASVNLLVRDKAINKQLDKIHEDLLEAAYIRYNPEGDINKMRAAPPSYEAIGDEIDKLLDMCRNELENTRIGQFDLSTSG